MLDGISDGRTDLVFDHLSEGHAANSKDRNGVSLIKWCAYYGDVSAIRFLLAKGESRLTTAPDPCRFARCPGPADRSTQAARLHPRHSH